MECSRDFACAVPTFRRSPIDHGVFPEADGKQKRSLAASPSTTMADGDSLIKSDSPTHVCVLINLAVELS